MTDTFTFIAITAGLLAGLSGAAWAQAPAGQASPCNCDGAAAPAAAAKHAISSKGTGSNRVAESTATPVQQIAPAAGGAGGATGTTKRPGHVSILR